MTTTQDHGTVAGEYELDTDHTRIGFAARHAMVTTVRGRFSEFSGGIVIDEAAPQNTRVDVVIDMASVDTGQTQRDEHLRSPDFFDVDTHPEMVFASTGVEHVEENRYVMHGDLTICGTTRRVSVDVVFHGAAVDPFGAHRTGFTGTCRILRSEFGLTYNAALELGGFLISDEVDVELDVSAVRSA